MELDGYTIRIAPARPPVHHSHVTIFIRGIPESVTEDEIRAKFSLWSIIKVSIIRRNSDKELGYAFVAFASENDQVTARAANPKITLGGHQSIVKLALSRPRNHRHANNAALPSDTLAEFETMEEDDAEDEVNMIAMENAETEANRVSEKHEDLYIAEGSTLVMVKLKEYNGSIEVAEGITKIGKEAFKGSKITSIKLPNSLSWIEERAFQDCSCLSSITLPFGVKSCKICIRSFI